MDLQKNLCLSGQELLTSDTPFLVSFLFVFISIFFIASFIVLLDVFIFKKSKNLVVRIISLMVSVLLVTFLGFASLLLREIYFELYDFPIASEYFVLNAAVKNTCYLDPQRNHCPKSLEDLIAIEPERFREMLRGKEAYYWYYPERNEYTLLVRHDSHRGVIFDPRFSEISGYADFANITLRKCGGKLEILTPLPIDGPWKEL